MSREREEDYVAPVQKDRVQTCLRLMQFSSEQKRPNIGDPGRMLDESNPSCADLAWVQGETIVFERVLRGKSRKDVEDIKDDAVLTLRER